MAVMMSSLRNESSSDEVDAICEIFAEVILLKSKLEHSIYTFLQDNITISINTIYLLESAITYLRTFYSITNLCKEMHKLRMFAD